MVLISKIRGHHVQWGLCLSAALMLSLAACKKPQKQASGAKDLAGAVGGEDESRENGGNGTRVRTCGSDVTDPDKALEAAFARMPVRLQQEFPAGSAIQMTADQKTLNATCTKVTVAQKGQLAPASGDSNWRACWGPGTTDATKDRPVVHLLKDANAVYANLISNAVWAFGGVYVDFVLPDRIRSIDQKTSMADLAADEKEKLLKIKDALQAFVTEYGQLRSEVASTFASIVSEGDPEIFKAYRARFTGKPVAVDSAEEGSGREAIDMLASNLAFQNFVLGEVAEDFYCSSKDSVLSKKKYDDLMRPFLKIHQALFSRPAEG